MIRQFEIGKAYHVMQIGDDTYKKIAFINKADRLLKSLK